MNYEFFFFFLGANMFLRKFFSFFSFLSFIISKQKQVQRKTKIKIKKNNVYLVPLRYYEVKLKQHDYDDNYDL